MEKKTTKDSESINSNWRGDSSQKRERVLQIEGYSLEGILIAGHEMCIIVPTLNLAFDFGKCPQHTISQQFLFISHGLHWQVSSACYLPAVPFHLSWPHGPHRKTTYEKNSTRGRILKLEHLRLILSFLASQLVHTLTIPPTYYLPLAQMSGGLNSEVTPNLDIKDPKNVDVLRGKIFIMESTYVEEKTTADNAREYGHTHLSEIINFADMFQNKAILLIHFSARYQLDVIQEAISAIPPPLAGRVFALTEGF
ncbi:hypothetical protein KY289_019085 [Solanum tuberosum]|nr:hypothetical protein KY289_019085 [Solanum tuberosum]